MNASLWELATLTAGMFFNLIVICQLVTTLEEVLSVEGKGVAGLYAYQWTGFAIGAFLLVGFFAYLHDWVMVGVSFLDLLYTITILCLIYNYRCVKNKKRLYLR